MYLNKRQGYLFPRPQPCPASLCTADSKHRSAKAKAQQMFLYRCQFPTGQDTTRNKNPAYGFIRSPVFYQLDDHVAEGRLRFCVQDVKRHDSFFPSFIWHFLGPSYCQDMESGTVIWSPLGEITVFKENMKDGHQIQQKS